MRQNFQRKLMTLLVLLLLSGSNLLAGNKQKFNPNEGTPILLIGIGLGINDYGFGTGIEVPVLSKLSVYGDLGIGGWGYKVGLGVNYHFNEITKGSVLSLGFANGSGMKSFETQLMVEPDEESELVNLDLNPVKTINFKYTYNFKMGSRSKFGLNVGYAVPLTTNNYKVNTYGVVLSESSKTILNIIQPGGLIFGFRFLFGIGNKG